MARAYLPVPRPSDMTHAPMDLAVAIAEGMARSGHNITFYAPTGARVRTATENLDLPPLAHDIAEFGELMASEAKHSHNILGLWDQYMAREMFERAQAGEYDLLHFHHPEAALPFASLYPDVPVIYTVHDPIEAWFLEALKRYQSPNQFFVSISDNQRLTAPDLPYVATVYNGIDPNLFSYSDTADDFLLFTGRITPEKGVREAIEVAKTSGHRLIIIGPVYDDQKGYFDTEIKPHLGEQITYLGLMERAKIAGYYQRAKALLFPVKWEEPFGLTMIEAMSCGTPVIAFRRGSVPEVVDHGRTGFIVDTATEMAAAVKQVDGLSRRDARNHVQQRFSNDHMVQGYLAAFGEALERAKTHYPATAKTV